MTFIDFWFDPISPYAYLAFERLPDALEGLSYTVNYRPVLFGGLLKHWDHKGPAEIAPKRDWTYRQVLWLGHANEVPIDMPAAPYPLATRGHFYEDDELADHARAAGFSEVEVRRPEPGGAQLLVARP